MTQQAKIKIPATLLRNPVHLLSTGFGSGLSPVAPGTMGTLMAIPFFLLAAQLPLIAYIALTVAMMLLGFWLCGQTSRALGVHDHGGIVWDEFVGFFITMIAIPVSWQSVVIGFLLFRLFDVWKPAPIHWLDRKVSGGLGIMIDDVVAGLYGFIVMQGLHYYHYL